MTFFPVDLFHYPKITINFFSGWRFSYPKITVDLLSSWLFFLTQNHSWFFFLVYLFPVPFLSYSKIKLTFFLVDFFLVDFFPVDFYSGYFLSYPKITGIVQRDICTDRSKVLISLLENHQKKKMSSKTKVTFFLGLFIFRYLRLKMVVSIWKKKWIVNILVLIDFFSSWLLFRFIFCLPQNYSWLFSGSPFSLPQNHRNSTKRHMYWPFQNCH